MNPRNRPRIVPTFLAISLALVLVACGSATGSGTGGSASLDPSPTPGPLASAAASAGGAEPVAVGGGAPAPTPTTTSTPSPTPTIDAAKAFVAFMTTGEFSGRATITGGITTGSAAVPVSGTLESQGRDSHQVMTIAFPGAPTTTESTTVNGVTYEGRGGLWFEVPAAADGGSGGGSGSGPGLASAIRSLVDVTDVGLETRAGDRLHHLKPRGTTPIPLSAVGVDDPVGDGAVTFEFFTRDDGRPVVMTLSARWTQVTGSSRQPVTMTIDYTFSSIGELIAIDAPTELWATFTSKRFGYSIAYPADWETNQSTSKTKPDALVSAEDLEVDVYRFPTKGSSLNGITSSYIAQVKRNSKDKLISNKPATVAGLRARRLEWSYVYKGTRGWIIESIVIRGKDVYFFDYDSLTKVTDDDHTLFDQFLSTVTFPATNRAGATNQAG